jgi:HPt (histidine-containing phosphotransfer) domain-containing protein
MDGLTATRLIRHELGLTDLPILAFTAGVRDEQQAAALVAGVDDVLAKPLDLEQMAVLLAKWVKPRPAAPGWVTVGQPVRSAPPSTGPEAFPDIAGIDRGQATKRLGRDRAMFIGLLGLFVDDFADAVERTRQDLGQGEREAAIRRMHTLRGNAGMLGALDLMELAGRLEEAIERGESGLDERLADLDHQLTALIEASAPWR